MTMLVLKHCSRFDDIYSTNNNLFVLVQKIETDTQTNTEIIKTPNSL